MIIMAVSLLISAIRHVMGRRQRIHPVSEERKATNEPSLFVGATQTNVSGNENEQIEDTHGAEMTIIDGNRLVEDETTCSNNESVISMKHGIPKEVSTVKTSTKTKKPSVKSAKSSPSTETKVSTMSDSGSMNVMTPDLDKEVCSRKKSLTEREFLDYEFDPKAGGKEMTWKGLYKHLESLLVFTPNPDLELYFNPESYIRNRYRTIIPFVSNRVKLETDTNDYINASYVLVNRVSRHYIITQGPLDNTIPHFWEMVWEQKASVIVMLCKVEEKGIEKCAHYWPTRNNGCIIAGFFMIEYISCTVKPSYRLSSFELNNLETGESRKIIHYQYTSWPDFGVPENPNVFLRFLIDVRKSGVMETDVNPVVVHCSAGIGRSGVFTLADVCLSLIENEKTLETLNITKLLHSMRMQRLGLVQTAEQLRFTYLAILTAAHSMGLSLSVAELRREATGSENKCTILPKPRLIYVRPALKEKKVERLVLSDSFYENLECSAYFSDSAIQPQISPSSSISSLFSINSYSSTGTIDNGNTLISAEPTSLQAHSASLISLYLDEEDSLIITTETETSNTVPVENVKKINEKKTKKKSTKKKRSWFKRLKHKMFGHRRGTEQQHM